MTMDGGNSYRVAETEVIELIKFGGRLAEAVAFIYAEHHRLAAFE